MGPCDSRRTAPLLAGATDGRGEAESGHDARMSGVRRFGDMPRRVNENSAFPAPDVKEM
jgi:hypothetical protein